MNNSKIEKVIETVWKNTLKFEDSEVDKLNDVGWTSLTGSRLITEKFMRDAIRFTAMDIFEEIDNNTLFNGECENISIIKKKWLG